jgi:hypothetical protein
LSNIVLPNLRLLKISPALCRARGCTLSERWGRRRRSKSWWPSSRSRPWVNSVNKIFCHLQGCQMVCFQTQNPNLGKFWRALDWQIYFMAVWNILWKFWTFYDHLVHFVRFGIHVPRKIWQPWSLMFLTFRNIVENLDYIFPAISVLISCVYWDYSITQYYGNVGITATFFVMGCWGNLH